MALFILPTSGPRTYRGKYPTRIRSVCYSRESGLHLELNDGTRLWTLRPAELPHDNAPELPRTGGTVATAGAFAMTAEQYATLKAAAELSRPGCTETERARASALRASIVPCEGAIALRNAKARRAETMAAEGRAAFDPAKPFRVYNRGPWGSVCFDFATLPEARSYLQTQAERRAFVTSGAAPAGPHGDSCDPLASFIIWPEGMETLASLGWNPPADGGRLWSKAPEGLPPAYDESVSNDSQAATLAGQADARPIGELDAEAAAPGSLSERAGIAVENSPSDNGASLAPVRRDNVEYHAGRAAFASGAVPAAMPYREGGERAARWNLGYGDARREALDAAAAPAAPALIAETSRAAYWRTQSGFVATLPGNALERDTGAGYARLDSLMLLKGESRETIESTLRAEVLRLESVARAAPVRMIDLTPTWSGMVPTLRALIENGNAEGRRTAWAEIAKAAALADERNRLARIEAAADLPETLWRLAMVCSESGALDAIEGMAGEESRAALAGAYAALEARRIAADAETVSGESA
jgi:hypothetical protein